MSTRNYEDACGIARSLDVIGERWALLVVRELVFGPKRFTDLRAGLKGISQNVLSQRLRDLEAAGIVRRTLLGPPASTRAYELTTLGHELEPVLVAMSRWGARTPVPEGAEMSNDAFALALKSLFVPSPGAAGFRGRARVQLVRDAFDVEIGADEAAGAGADRIDVARAAGPDPSLVIEGAESTLRAVMFGRRTLPAALRAGDLRIEGDAGEASAFLARFALPD
ncbi:winged helix-turn-helix transcriptional regulator [Agromyces sp. MMS24-K17]|uniref:winged helix-turn-helix transcriptional regulator n=1 Tax=Agromyces sp. MMS24-K17 TaxID=3372850 RepID=UPI0037541A96